MWCPAFKPHTVIKRRKVKGEGNYDLKLPWRFHFGHQHFIMDGRGAHEAPSLLGRPGTKRLLWEGEPVIFFSGTITEKLPVLQSVMLHLCLSRQPYLSGSQNKNPSALGRRGRWISVTSRPTWSIQHVPGSQGSCLKKIKTWREKGDMLERRILTGSRVGWESCEWVVIKIHYARV